MLETCLKGDLKDDTADEGQGRRAEGQKGRRPPLSGIKGHDGHEYNYIKSCCGGQVRREGEGREKHGRAPTRLLSIRGRDYNTHVRVH